MLINMSIVSLMFMLIVRAVNQSQYVWAAGHIFLSWARRVASRG